MKGKNRLRSEGYQGETGIAEFVAAADRALAQLQVRAVVSRQPQSRTQGEEDTMRGMKHSLVEWYIA